MLSSQRLADLVALQVLLEPRHVEADFLGGRERPRLVDLAAAGEQLLVEVEILLAGLVLHAHRDRDLRGLDRAGPEHREFLEHDLELRVLVISSIMSVSARLQ